MMKNSRKHIALAVVLALAFTTVFSSISVSALTKPTKLTAKVTKSVIYVGDTAKVSVKSVKPAKASKAVTYKSSNAKVAKVSKAGKVTGLKAGTAKITVASKYKSSNGKRAKAVVKITVKAKAPADTNTRDKVIVDKETKTIKIKATVNGVLLNETCTQHLVVNKDGNQGANSILNSNIDVNDFYKALVTVAGERMWNRDPATKLDPTGQSAPSSIKEALEKGIGSSDFAEFAVTISWGGKEYKLTDIISEVDKDQLKTIFAGNIDFQNQAGSGCITCIGSCFAGITTGYSLPIKTTFKPVATNLPAAGETVTVTYTLIK